MCLNPRSVARRDVYGSWHLVTVSCGKCWECVRKRQNEMAALVVRESEFRGSLVHCTFSYAPEHLPLYYVRRFYDADSGEPCGVSAPKRISRSTELFTDAYSDLLLSEADSKYWRPFSRRIGRGERNSYLSQRRESIALYSDIVPAQERADSLSRSRKVLSRRESLIRSDYLAVYGRRECRRSLLVDSRLSEDGRFWVDTEVFPSLSRKDLSLYIKRRRVQYEREFGRKLPAFSYNFIGEYGPKRGRPHLHMCICGLDEKDCAWLVSDWHKNVGNVICKRVQRYKKGVSGHDGFEAAGKYIGKYLAKGQEFEEENVVRGFVERPRRCCSANFGVGDLSALRAFHLCYDLFGQYDVSRPSTYPSDKSALVDWVLSRMYLTINGHKYPIPRRIKQFIFYEDVVQFSRSAPSNPCAALSTYVDSETFGSWSALYSRLSPSRRLVKRSSVLSRLVSSRLQSDSLRDYSEKLRAFTGKPLEKTSYFERFAFENRVSLAARERSNSIAASQHKFLQKSAF